MKAYIFATSITLFLIFIWWFIGGNITGAYIHPSPLSLTISFLLDNFQTGLATIFEIFNVK